MYIICIIYMHFICSLSDVIIKTFSQSVSQVGSMFSHEKGDLPQRWIFFRNAYIHLVVPACIDSIAINVLTNL